MPHACAMVGALRILPLLALAACSAPAAPRATAGAPGHVTAPAPDGSTKLVVLVVLDQWPEWAFEVKRPALRGGFARLLAEGDWRVGRYPSAATLTGPDHALLGTGKAPAQSGIIADEWWHRDSGLLLESVHDADGSISPKWLRVPALGDAIDAAKRGARAVDVALKPRAAILPLGRHGLSIWYDAKAVAMTTWQPPPWLVEWNRTQPIAPRLKEPWTPLDPQHLAQLSGVADDQPGEAGTHELGKTFPHDASASKDPGHALLSMPLGNDVVIETATRAIEAEKLGQRDTTDFLVIALSAHDYVGHAYGQESWEMWDLELRLDARLDKLLDDLDRLVGAGKWAMIVTGDHGASPMPEKLNGGRLTPEQLKTAANNAATAVLGPGSWIDDTHEPNIFFSSAMLAQPKGELESATKHVINALRAFPGLERVDRVANFAGHCDKRTGDDRALCLCFDPERSGDLFYFPANGWIFEGTDDHAATAHGSLHDYDRNVPVILLAPGRTRHAAQESPSAGEFAMTDVATTLAEWLGVTPP